MTTPSTEQPPPEQEHSAPTGPPVGAETLPG